MSSSSDCIPRKTRISLKIGSRAPVVPLALIAAVAATDMAQGQALKLESTWPGQYDTDSGWVHSRLACAASAQPTIAVSNGDWIHIAADFNYGTYHRNGTPTFQEPVADFFGNGLLPANFEIGTPQLLYDNDANRFIMADTAIHVGTQRAWITIGASAVSTPFPASDCTYKIDANILPGAGPTNFYATDASVGMTADSIVVAANMHNFSDGKFQYSKVWVLSKSALYNTPLHSCPLVSPNPSFVAWGLNMPGGTIASDVVATKSFDPNSSVTYLLSAWGGHGSELALWTLDTNPRQPSLAPSITAASVPTKPYAQPPAAAQKGTTTKISTLDARLSNAVYRPGAGLWTAHAVVCDPDTTTSCFRWYQIDPQTRNVVQTDLPGYVGASVYAPAVAVNREGDAVFVYNSSGPDFYPSVDVVGRRASDPLNTLRKPALRVATGLGPYQRQGVTLNAPGLRTSTDTDPTDDNRFWTIGAYASGRGADCPNGQSNYDWATQVGAVSFSGQ
jgi:hypothetical protein